jgi:hypothetical protein
MAAEEMSHRRRGPADDDEAAGAEIDQPGAPVEASVEDLLGDWDENERREYEEDLEAIEAAERAALVDGWSLRFAVSRH